ncbi:TetR family transcriptional regulator [Nocardia aurea]|uniref:TetR family transcriptional regulator n=1 Tax=Nocardia aurea TaxID=2144174 RepID=UPI0033BF483E
MDADPTRARSARVDATREAILVAAERLFAENGIAAVSHRQIGEAAGQGNTGAVGYHFGAKIDLVRAIARGHGEPIERRRSRMVAAAGDSTDLRDWVACLVCPTTEHLARLRSPTWYARFTAQVTSDPLYREVIGEEIRASGSVARIVEGFDRCLPDLPREVHRERGDISRLLIVHMCAERERALADGEQVTRPTWDAAASGLIAAIVGLWQAPHDT